MLSVYTDRIADELCRFLKSCNGVMTLIFFRWFYRQKDRGIQTGISIQWRDTVTDGLTDGYIDGIFLSVIPSVKANIYPLCDSLFLYFSFFFPFFFLIPTLPSQTIANHLSQLSPSSQHKHSSFLYFCTWSQHSFSKQFIVDFIIYCM